MSRSLERLKVTRQVGKRVQLRLLVLCAARRHLSNPTSNEASKVTGKGMFITVVTATFYEAFVIFQGVIGAAMEIKSCSAQGRLEGSYLLEELITEMIVYYLFDDEVKLLRCLIEDEDFCQEIAVYLYFTDLFISLTSRG
ncbi:hypothetical protein Tco_1056223 [Tanacetum coccineum]|uniref:Uncharacterized protein n=1 Tax=Tanacetum coccineum TaxID=301880 RepID=A0ABQ5H307_9ASTR